MNTLYPIQEIEETGDPENANALLAVGWKLLGVFQRAKVNSHGESEAWALYVLGRGEAPRELMHIDRVREVREDEADDALRKGAVLLKVITRKGEEDEYPCFIIGRPRADQLPAAQSPKKFNGNGVH